MHFTSTCALCLTLHSTRLAMPKETRQKVQRADRRSVAEPTSPRTVGLTFRSSERPTPLGPLPSFKDRLQATDTWNVRVTGRCSEHLSSTAGPRVQFEREPSLASTNSFRTDSSPASRPRTSSETSSRGAGSPDTLTSGSSGPRRTRPSGSTTSGISAAASSRELPPHQSAPAALNAVEVFSSMNQHSGGQASARPMRGASRNSGRRSQSAPYQPGERPHRATEGRAGQVASSITVHPVGGGGKSGRRGPGGDAGGRRASGRRGDDAAESEAGQAVQVEVDLRKLLGI